MRKVLLFSALLFFSCVNFYTKYYRGIEDATTLPSYEEIQSDLQVYKSNDFNKDINNLKQKGHVVIGEASFNASRNADGANEEKLRSQAKLVGAHIVLISSQYTHTESGAVPLTVPKTTTSYSSGNATAYGPGGVVNVYGGGTTTTYGSQTIMMPYSVARSDYNAVFLAKVRPRVGIYSIPLDNNTRRRLQTNSGIIVDMVIDGSPAFQADFLPGDVILAVQGEAIQSPKHFNQLLDKYMNQPLFFTIDRDGKGIEKELFKNHIFEHRKLSEADIQEKKENDFSEFIIKE